VVTSPVSVTVVGGLAMTLVYMFLVVPLKTGVLPPNMGGLFMVGFLPRPGALTAHCC
jgi:hypothetical protein